MDNIGQGHAKGREDASILVNYHCLHAKGPSDTACMLPSSPSIVLSARMDSEVGSVFIQLNFVNTITSSPPSTMDMTGIRL